jgi:UDP-N-acetylmuramoyl-L-alanyl-D-glutamate--2,6-diaminopimelate ligase
LAASVPGAVTAGNPLAGVASVTHDSRLVTPGTMFAALRGGDFDGHDFIAEAEKRGASSLLVERAVETRLPYLLVSDSRAALSAVAASFHGHPSRQIGVIGITGTDGKTTTSYLVDHILRKAGFVTGMIGTVAIRIGETEDLHASRQTTPESHEIQCCLRQMVEARASWAVVEATSHGLAMHRLDNVDFRIGAVTNITHEHLDFHGSAEAYRRAKALLAERVGDARGTLIVNADDPGALSVVPFAQGATVVRFSMADRHAELQASLQAVGAGGSHFQLEADNAGVTDVKLPLLGEFNVANALCAVGVALAAGVDLPRIAGALATAPPVPGRMAPVDAGQPFHVIIDYAHTPDSLAKVLRLLRRLHPGGRLLVVFGSAGERDVAKRPIQGTISAQLADVVVVTSEDPRGEDAEAIIAQIAAGAVSAGAISDETLFRRTERRDAIRLAIELARPGDCILLAGKGHEGSIIWGREKRPWDEAAVARELLAEAGFAIQPA